MTKEFNPINPDKFLDITKATAQEVAEFSLNHLIKQGRRSVDSPSGSTCKYDGFDGLMCAAAPFIQDKDLMVEKKSWSEQVKGGAVSQDHCYLISALQNFHDSTLISLCFMSVKRGLQRLSDAHNIDLSKYSAEDFKAYFA